MSKYSGTPPDQDSARSTPVTTAGETPDRTRVHVSVYVLVGRTTVYFVLCLLCLPASVFRKSEFRLRLQKKLIGFIMRL